MGNTSIEWTDKTWNPLRGCSRVSEGCRNCYAESVAYRFSGPGQAYEGLVRIGANGNRRREWNGQIAFVEEHLLDPLKWRMPRRIFVNSMSDLFHENVRREWVADILAVILLCPQHTFQILTKRPERANLMLGNGPGIGSQIRAMMIAESLVRLCPNADLESLIGENKWPLPNLWFGVSCEDQAAADKRIPLLLQTPAAVRFVSAEPLLGPIDLTRAVVKKNQDGEDWYRSALECGDVWWTDHGEISDGPEYPALDWAIIGGESGTGARPMHPGWARGLRDQCASAGVPFFFKQWGEWLPTYPTDRKPEGNVACHQWNGGVSAWRVGKKKAGAMLDGREWREFPA